MAKLLDLPPELLLTITSFLWSNQPAKKRLFEASNRRDRQTLANSLERERLSVIDLSSTCKALYEVLQAEKYRIVSIHGHDSVQKLFSLLRLIRLRPEIGNHIQQLHLQLVPDLEVGNISRLSSDQLRFLKLWAETIGVFIDDEVLLNALKYETHENVEDSRYHPSRNGSSLDDHDETCLSILYSMLCYYLQKVKEITLSGSWSRLSILPGQLLSPLRSRNLPHLQSLVLDTGLPRRFFMFMDSSEIRSVAEVANGISEVYLRGFILRHTIDMAYSNHFLHSLVLQDVQLPVNGGGSVYSFLESCKSLSKFIFLRTNNHHDMTLPRPLRMKNALKNSRNSLRTLCLYYGSGYYFPLRLWTIDTFEGFPRLESLWFDAWSCGWAVRDGIETDKEIEVNEIGADIEIESESNFAMEGLPTLTSAKKLVKTLPPSLRRLHIDGPMDRVYGNMTCLATHCRDGMMPRLKEVAFGEWNSKFAIDKVRSAFRKAGVNQCKVDKDVIMW
ncbi:hypothetical protein LZ32DRAFT_636035 [Colletotrichum eremochloae]|nr:hypothetical protein LZ32DRAFT_636035 [Colletotrichum eremochloae]